MSVLSLCAGLWPFHPVSCCVCGTPICVALRVSGLATTRVERAPCGEIRVCGRRGASGSAGDARRRTRRIKSAPPRDTRSRTVIRGRFPHRRRASAVRRRARTRIRPSERFAPRAHRARGVRRVAGIRPRVRASRVRERDRDTVTHLTRSTEVRREKIMRIAPRRAQGNSASCATHTRFHHIPVAGQRYPAARARQRSLDAR